MKLEVRFACRPGRASGRIMDSPRRAVLAGAFVMTSLAGMSILGGSRQVGAQTSTDSVPLYDDLGSYSRRIVTSVPLAQRYFDQGMRLTFGFGHPEAQRAFREAVRLDPRCAMCHWGLAWSLGPYINGPRPDSTSAAAAYAAAQRAVALKRSVAPVDQALIEAMAARYVEVPTRRNRTPLDSVYARAMRDVVTRFPDDLDAAALLGEALMVLRPWDQWTRAGDPKPGTEEAVAVLESVLARDIRHPGACHHYIHATEASRDPGRAAACADHLGDVIPGASHIPHMPSHTYMRIGRYGDAVRANQRAWHADQRAAHGGAPGIYPPHNLHMLLSAASYDGQSAVANQAARDLARAFPENGFFPVLVLARFGRWQELLELPPLTRNGFQRGLSHFGRGLAHLGLGQIDSAVAYRDSLQAIHATTGDSLRFRRHSQKAILGIARAILTAEVEAAAGRHEMAVAALRDALPLEDSLAYDEPEPWPIPLRHVLGAILLERGDAAEAMEAYLHDLRVHPDNGWALMGLAQSLERQGRAQEANEVRARFTRAWSRADVWLQGSRVPPRPPQSSAQSPVHH